MMSMQARHSVLSPWWLITLVALISMLAPFSIDTYLPSFPAIEAELGVSREWLTQSLSVYLAFFAVSTLLWGPLADRFGRRRVVLLSLLGYLMAALLCALAEDYFWLLIGRALQGVMAAGSVVASRAMIRDFFRGPEAQKALAVVMMLFTLAPALAPIIGGWLDAHLGWRSVFYFLAAFALLILPIFLVKIPETQAPESVQSIHPHFLMRSYVHSLRHPLFLRLVIVQGLLIGGFFIYVASSASLIFDHLHLQEQDFWILFLPMVSGILLGSWLSHRLAHRITAVSMVNLAFILALFAIALNVALQSLSMQEAFWVIAPLSVYAVGFALANPGLTVFGLDCLPDKRGMAASLQSLVQMGTAGLVTSLIVPVVHDSLFMMAVSQALMLLSAFVIWRWLKTHSSFEPIVASQNS
ncbi:multidrug effflux MFS transporter [Thiomicrorhabdus xiamenensis]|uniref:Bcr/CflA family efflux transporter n=1 Tax=Thiomicrorhabdus xiamenensis TaxID=2739063 RepID=A0A7D4T1Q1_9GAMM|nr:multidrug effflux MFS transporter [Thiomicrorhabdus xiamenensis]QKI90102.1 multidrug effflux MFS transporter [Thiomicrorhabdus xiamenensis]